MFVTLEDFFDNYRIKNQQQPNETVLNRGLLRLKRETRELKSIVDVLIGNNLSDWNSNKIYEQDEYVLYNDLVYKSRQDRNFNNIPYYDDETNWEIITIDSNSGSKQTVIKSHTFTATENQTTFILPFNIEGVPLVFVEGLLLSPDVVTVSNNIEIQLSTVIAVNETVTIIGGVTYDSSLVIAKERFVATAGQYLFETSFNIKNPSVFINGILIDETEYVWSNNTINLNDPLIGNETVIIGNGSVLGLEIYTTDDIDNLLTLKRDVLDSYSKTDIDDLLDLKATIQYVDDEILTLNTAKANWGTTLASYGITDAYTKTAVNTALGTKLDAALFTDAVILQKIKNVDGSGSGLDADLLDGLTSTKFLRTDIENYKFYNFSIMTPIDEAATIPEPLSEFYFDVDPTNPTLYIRTYDETSGDLVKEATVYTDKNTENMMIVREGYFKGSWEPTLNITFGITNYTAYNWFVIVSPTVTGYEHDYNKDFANGHTPFTGFDNNITWDENQSEYHYGYIENNIVKMQAVHRNGSTNIDIPARYQLVGMLKTFSSLETVNQV